MSPASAMVNNLDRVDSAFGQTPYRVPRLCGGVRLHRRALTIPRILSVHSCRRVTIRGRKTGASHEQPRATELAASQLVTGLQNMIFWITDGLDGRYSS